MNILYASIRTSITSSNESWNVKGIARLISLIDRIYVLCDRICIQTRCYIVQSYILWINSFIQCDRYKIYKIVPWKELLSIAFKLSKFIQLVCVGRGKSFLYEWWCPIWKSHLQVVYRKWLHFIFHAILISSRSRIFKLNMIL